jgi:flagellar basal body rod protein FlgG
MVALIEARRSFEANTKVVKVEDEMTRSALNIVA